MKNVKYLLNLLVFLFFVSCSLSVDFDNEDTKGRITANAIGNNIDGSVSEDGYLDLEVIVFDKDGIASVRIEIPALNIDFLTTNNSYKSTQNINQTFNVDEISPSNSNIIFVTLMDNNSNVYSKTLAFMTE